MSTLQHTSQLRERATRRLVLIVLIATLVAGGIAAGIVAIFSIFFFPWIVIAVWLVVAGVLLFVSTGRRASASVLSR